MNLLMISGHGALTIGQRGAFYNTLEEFHKYWDRIDIISPQAKNHQPTTDRYFENVFMHSSPWPLIFQPWWILKKGQEIFKEQQFDLVTIHDYPPFYNGLGGWWLTKKIKTPYVSEIMHIPGLPRAGNPKERFYSEIFKFWARLVLKKGPLAVRVINEEIRKNLIKLGVSDKKIKLWPAFYIDLDIFKPQALPKKYDLIFVGRLEPNKGVGLFLEAVKQSGLTAIVIGQGPLKENLKLKIKNLKLQNNVLLYGWAKDSVEIASLLNQSRLLVTTSLNEGGPRVVLEALACGIPVLGTPVGIIPEIIGDGQAGKIINWQAQEIAQKAQELLNNPGEYSACQQAGLEIVKQFEKKTAIKKYAEGLQSLL